MILDDDLEDIKTWKDLHDFVDELRECTHADLRAVSIVYNVVSVEDEED